ncbi:MAG: PhoH family protein [Myxococcales bacterium]|nr:PhoH family protein [Myxococcales bacterium]
MPETRRLTVGFQDSEGLRALCGERDANLRRLEARLNVQVIPRGHDLHLHGGSEEVALAADVLHSLFARARAGGVVDFAALDRAVDARGQPVASLDAHRARTPRRADDADPAGGTVLARTPGQRRYVDAIAAHDVMFGLGPAGSGKTFLAMACALQALQRREVKRLVLTRPAVEAGERLGFLPGDLTEKVSPYLRPLYDALRDLVDEDRFVRLTERGSVEVAPLGFLRGRTLANSFVILDEAQNCTIDQMRMVLTRLGEHSKVIVTGDPSQSDLPGHVEQGLSHAVGVLEGTEGVAVVRLGIEDVVRHPLVGRIIEAYDADRARRTQGTRGQATSQPKGHP